MSADQIDEISTRLTNTTNIAQYPWIIQCGLYIFLSLYQKCSLLYFSQYAKSPVIKSISTLWIFSPVFLLCSSITLRSFLLNFSALFIFGRSFLAICDSINLIDQLFQISSGATFLTLYGPLSLHCNKHCILAYRLSCL
jgi:hypothetical protein